MKKRFGLIGHPLGHSLSPPIHNRIMEFAGIDGQYEMYDIPVAELPRFIPGLLNDLDGFNATIPHKTNVFPYMESLDETARLCGAVNTVYKKRGYNTDVSGFKSAGIELAGKNILILGSGGSAHMMAATALQDGAKSLEIITRSKTSLEKLLNHINSSFDAVEAKITARLLPELPKNQPDVILNATPLGMWPKAHDLPCTENLFVPGLTVFDPIYNPTPTRFVLNAKKHGGRAVGGLRMLLRQAIEAQQIWNPDIAFDVQQIENAILPELLEELYKSFSVKLLVTGFMRAGKTTIAQLLAKKMKIAFLDLDSEIEKTSGKKINQIFAERGESEFRIIETAVAESVLCHNGAAVIASGGGFPCQATNRKMIRESNTLVLHLSAPFDVLWERIEGNPSRPLASKREETEKLYNERAPIYSDFCDCEFDSSPDPEDVVDNIYSTITSLEI